MKARVIETGEIVDVKRLYPTIYSRLNENNRIAEEYYDDEIELIDKPKMISIEKACKWLEKHAEDFMPPTNSFHDYNIGELIHFFKKEMEGGDK